MMPSDSSLRQADAPTAYPAMISQASERALAAIKYYTEPAPEPISVQSALDNWASGGETRKPNSPPPFELDAFLQRSARAIEDAVQNTTTASVSKALEDGLDSLGSQFGGNGCIDFQCTSLRNNPNVERTLSAIRKEHEQQQLAPDAAAALTAIPWPKDEPPPRSPTLFSDTTSASSEPAALSDLHEEYTESALFDGSGGPSSSSFEGSVLFDQTTPSLPATAAMAPHHDPKDAIPPQEVAALNEFRKLLDADAAASCGDFTARRFLRARKLHVSKAHKMYCEYMQWRQREGIDQLISEPLHSEEIEAAMAESFTARVLYTDSSNTIPLLDVRGRPVFYLDVGALDVSRLKRAGITVEMLCRRYCKELERLRIALDAHASHPLRGQLAILNIRGCKVSTFIGNIRLWTSVARLGNAYYPEMMGCCCCINGPGMAAWAVRVGSRWCDPETAAKVELWSPQDTAAALAAHLGGMERVPRELLM